MGVHALAQRRARWSHRQTECAHEEGVAPKVLDGIKVTLAQTQQSKIGFEDVTAGCTRAHAELQIDQGVDVDAFKVFADKGQSGVGVEVARQLFDNKFGQVRTHFLGKQYIRAKLMISKGK